MDLIGILILLGISLGAMWGIAAWTGIFWFGLAAFTAVFGGLIYQGIGEIPPDPPHKGVLTFLRKRRKVLVSEGWHFFLLRPFLFGVILIEVTKINFDFAEQLVRTPDFAALSIPVSITIIPGAPDREFRPPDDEFPEGRDIVIPERWKAEALIEYLNSGGEKGVKNILADIVRERLRRWAISRVEGPRDWPAAIGAEEEASAVLFKAIMGEGLQRIPSVIPTPLLMKYFRDPTRRLPDMIEEEWNEVREGLTALPSEEVERIREAVERRRREVRKISEGNGFFRIRHLGVILNRLNIGDIKLTGELARVAELEAKERQEWQAEATEFRLLNERAKEIAEERNLTYHEVLEAAQVERGKVTKTVNVRRLSMDEETRGTLREIAGQVFPRREEQST